jgi:hypothetical protein
MLASIDVYYGYDACGATGHNTLGARPSKLFKLLKNKNVLRAILVKKEVAHAAFRVPFWLSSIQTLCFNKHESNSLLTSDGNPN